MKIELDDKDWKLLEKHLGIYVEKNYLKLDPHFIDLYNQILEQHYASKVKELKEWTFLICYAICMTLKTWQS